MGSQTILAEGIPNLWKIARAKYGRITQILEIPGYIGILWKTNILRKIKMMPKIAKIAIKALRYSFIGIVLLVFTTGCSSVRTYEQNIIPERLV
jgi:hypothetical protein